MRRAPLRAELLERLAAEWIRRQMAEETLRAPNVHAGAFRELTAGVAGRFGRFERLGNQVEHLEYRAVLRQRGQAGPGPGRAALFDP